MSSRLGCVAADIAIVSPSQPSPAVIQRMWSSVSLRSLRNSELGMFNFSDGQSALAELYPPELYPKFLRLGWRDGLVLSTSAGLALNRKIPTNISKYATTSPGEFVS